jgi:hypothetical protein
MMNSSIVPCEQCLFADQMAGYLAAMWLEFTDPDGGYERSKL